MKKKIMILGSGGLIGHQILMYLSTFNEFKIINVSHTKKANSSTILFDLSKFENIEFLLMKYKPNFIINCVGILIENSELMPISAIALNAYLPHFLRNIADKIKSKIIHISTDCIGINIFD